MIPNAKWILPPVSASRLCRGPENPDKTPLGQTFRLSAVGRSGAGKTDFGHQPIFSLRIFRIPLLRQAICVENFAADLPDAVSILTSQANPGFRVADACFSGDAK